MNPLSFAGILGGLASLAFGLFVFVQNPRRTLYRKWFLFTISVAAWGPGALAISLVQSPALSYLVWRLTFGLSIIWVLPLFLDFVMEFCEIKSAWQVTAGYLSALFFSMAAITTPYFFAGVRPVFGQFYYGVPDFRLFSLFLVWWIVLIAYTHYLLIRAYPSSPEPKRRQVRYFFLATALGFGFGSLTFLPLLHIDVYPWGDFVIPLYPIIMSYAMIEYQLMDINLLAKRTLISSITVAGLAFGLLLSGFGSQWLAQNFGIPQYATALFGAVIAGILGQAFWLRTKKLDRLRYEFVVVAAHKLRTPLSEIRWSASTISGTHSLEEAHSDAANIVTSAKRMIDLVNNLLKSVEMEDDTYSYKSEPCDMREIGEKVLAEHAISLQQKHLHASLTSSLERPLVIGDREKIAEVVQIFLENATNYTPDGGSITMEIATHTNDFIIFSIKDSGIGIEEKDLPHLFTRFYRADNVLKISTEGSGLGLFIAKEIIERHRGSVGVDSEGPGKGANLWFILPRADYLQ